MESIINMQVVDEIKLIPSPPPFKFFMVDDNGYLTALSEDDLLEKADEVRRNKNAVEKG